jgi:[CysO sulfur-carrier protein]-S-L-cysteine hydrolase
MYYDSKASYLILSLAEESPVLKAFGVKDGEAVQQTLEIIG